MSSLEFDRTLNVSPWIIQPFEFETDSQSTPPPDSFEKVSREASPAQKRSAQPRASRAQLPRPSTPPTRGDSAAKLLKKQLKHLGRLDREAAIRAQARERAEQYPCIAAVLKLLIRLDDGGVTGRSKAYMRSKRAQNKQLKTWTENFSRDKLNIINAKLSDELKPLSTEFKQKIIALQILRDELGFEP